MKISRRDFLSTVTGSAATLLAFPFTASGRPSPQSERQLDCVLLDLKSHCALRESLHGYQAALAGEHNYLQDAISDSRCRYGIVIVPGLGPIEPTLAQTLSELLRAGTHLLLESGAGFLGAAEFAAHQRMLHRYFDLRVEPPVALWSRNPTDDAFFSHRSGRHPKKELGSHESIPYVNYVWPLETKVRDFSRVIPVSAKVEDVVGRVGALPVALKRRVDKGILIFLGSPLGPALRAGDPEAGSWLRLVKALCLGAEKTRALNAVKLSKV